MKKHEIFSLDITFTLFGSVLMSLKYSMLTLKIPNTLILSDIDKLCTIYNFLDQLPL